MVRIQNQYESTTVASRAISGRPVTGAEGIDLSYTVQGDNSLSKDMTQNAAPKFQKLRQLITNAVPTGVTGGGNWKSLPYYARVGKRQKLARVDIEVVGEHFTS